MHEGPHGILEQPAKHAHYHPPAADHRHPHESDPVACESCDKPAAGRPGAELWQKVFAGAVVAALVIAFLVWRFR